MTDNKDKQEFLKMLEDGILLSIARGKSFDGTYLYDWHKSKRKARIDELERLQDIELVHIGNDKVTINIGAIKNRLSELKRETTK